MSIPRAKFRELLFQVLFCLEWGDVPDEIHEVLMGQVKVARSAAREALDYATKIFSTVEELDSRIKNVSLDYPIERISTAELTAMRLALYEMLYDVNVPAKVAISEAIRLVRKFGSVDSSAFVNAILDSIYKKNENVDADVAEQAVH